MTIDAADDLDLIDAETHSDNSASNTTATTIPEKYSGKTVEDLIKMHQNAEKKISQQGADLAVQRRLSDTILGMQKTESTTAKKDEPRPPVTVDSLLADPEKALRSAVDSSDAARRAVSAEERVARLEASMTQKEFVSKHSNFTQDLQNPEFIAWVQKNPVRASLGTAASKEDFQAATALWDMWEEHKELAGKPKGKQAEGSRKGLSTLKPAPSSNGEQEAPRFSRAKVMELRMRVQQGDAAAVARWNDPGFQARLNQAYSEDRVK